MKSFLTCLTVLLAFTFSSCNNKTEADLNPGKERELSEGFTSYWYNNTAEITTYSLQMERYGEMREGTAVLIYVTEDFLPDEQVKANRRDEETIPILKLNSTKNFMTGIYPYSMMSSTFFPVLTEGHALKVSTSIQEWCGNTYAQINNRNAFEITSHSYFQNEADQNFNLEKTWLEDEFWTLLRIEPTALPTGEITAIPSLEFTRLRHKTIKPMRTVATLTEEGKLFSYSVFYPSLERTLTIWFEKEAPFVIEEWEEQIGEFTSKAVKINQIQTPYWNNTSNTEESMREELFNSN